MKKPVILTVDDDVDVLRAVERDLRRQYGERFRVMRADSGAAALELVQQLKLRNESPALFLVDQRMPRMSGVEFLEQALRDFPNVKRALLTAYADTDAAISAINSVQIDHYLMKPWDPPEERLYPVLDDLLDDWLAGFHPPFEGIRVVGLKWSPQTHAVKDFLARNQIPYQWLDVEIDAEARKLDEQAGNGKNLPLVLFPDGSRLRDPAPEAVAERVGLRTRAQMPAYDLAIIGAGPAGLAAAVYGASEGLTTVMIEREAPGGQAGSSSRIENYLGFPSGLSGSDLTRRAVAQARRFGAEILTPQTVTRIRCNGPYRVLTLSEGSEISCQALLIATGVSYRRLDIAGDREPHGRRRLLRRGGHRGDVVQGSRYLHRWSGKFRRPGCDVSLTIRQDRYADRAWRIARKDHVAVPDRSTCEDAEYRRAIPLARDRSPRQRQARCAHHRERSERRNQNRSRDRTFHFHWSHAAYQPNRRSHRMRRARIHLVRPGFDRERPPPAQLAAAARSLFARDQRPRHFRCG